MRDGSWKWPPASTIAAKSWDGAITAKRRMPAFCWCPWEKARFQRAGAPLRRRSERPQGNYSISPAHSLSRRGKPRSESLLVVGKSIQIFRDLPRAGFPRHADARHLITIAGIADHAKLRNDRTIVSRLFHLPNLARAEIAGHSVGKAKRADTSPDALFDLSPRAGELLKRFFVCDAGKNGMSHRMGTDLPQSGVGHFPKLAPGTRPVFCRSILWNGNRHAHALIQTAGHRLNPRVALFRSHSIERAKNALELTGRKLIGSS